MWAVLDAVFTEDDALSKEKRQTTVGRCYEQWKRTRAQLDPDFDPKSEIRRPMASGSVLKSHKKLVKQRTKEFEAQAAEGQFSG